MDFLINENELAVLYGLPHIQQLTYLRGIRPYMDVKTGLVGIKRGISYQSLAEQLYIEPHPGIKSVSYSRAQMRRALAGLERSGLINLQSEGLQLILKCSLATLGYFVQNKAVTNPSQQNGLLSNAQFLENSGVSPPQPLQEVIADSSKADTPLKEDNYYIYLLSQFEQFWDLYPLKKSQAKAWEQFQALAPNRKLCIEIMNALQEQIKVTQQLKNQGQWVAPWKYPANWLVQQCWNDEVTMDESQEKNHANSKTHYSKQQTRDSLWDSCKSGFDLEEASNVIELTTYRSKSQIY
jgi:hypothetical protein